MQRWENRFPWNGLRHLEDSWNAGNALEFLSSFLLRAPPLEMGREGRKFFPEESGKGSLISSYEAVTGLLCIGLDPRASCGVEMGRSANLLSCSKGVKDPFKVPEVRFD